MPTRPSPLCRFVLAASLLACGASGTRPRLTVAPLIEGEGQYRLRRNPAPCLVGAPELDYEAETPHGWERISLENAEEDQDHVAQLVLLMNETPLAYVFVRGQLRAELVGYSDHHARTLTLLEAATLTAEPAEPAGPAERPQNR